MTGREPNSATAIRAIVLSLTFLSLSTAASAQQANIEVREPAVLLATISVRCDACRWELTGREGLMLRVTLDGHYSQHLAVVRPGLAPYRILLGSVDAGVHKARVEIDSVRSARDLRATSPAQISITEITPVLPGDPAYRPLSLAPFVYQRANTLNRFTDTPVFMWYEAEPTARGVRYRYTVIFTNEDGGTPADRLMATWGRTTDIEYIYSVEVDAAGTVLEHDYQGPDHQVLPYRGKLDRRHARLWVATDNNMVVDRGTTPFRFAPAPEAVDLTNVSREVMMDRSPWLYAVSSRELAREGKIAPNAPPGNGVIPDPRQYAYLEGCGTVGDVALALAVRVGPDWIASDRGVDKYRITRDGCFRVAIPLPPNTDPQAIAAVRVQAFARDDRTAVAPATFTRLNTVFLLDDNYVPGPSLAHWEGSAPLTAGGAPLAIQIK